MSTPTAPIGWPSSQEALSGRSVQESMMTTAEGPIRVRKRDPRLACENFLAGKVPCSCPEVDEKEAAEAVGAVAAAGKKRVKTGGGVAAARCQVPGCGADIRELKGYHRRHRVCLRCANAPSVVVDGEPKRYCQQCGKFHILPDFDEGKRSCRRKLERHNKRRRRRAIDHKSLVEKEKGPVDSLLVENVACNEEPTKVSAGLLNEAASGLLNEAASGVDSLCVSNRALNTEMLLEPEDGHASGETQMEERIDNSKSAISSSFCDDKSAYSSVCPTGRISFKLYDWNPAEFPRRLRLQIFQWLASMPVELEGYIRPGCTFLTVFITMPHLLWDKLSKEASVYVNDLVKSPESLFWGKGNMLIYLDNMIFQVMKDGTSLTSIKMEVHVPKLHYVHPTYFEAGKPMEFIACGSDLLRSKFRFLVSFAGNYLTYESCNAISHGTIKSCHEIKRNHSLGSEHEMLMVRISYTEPELFGPAFIEVENESGVSNFIPVLFGNKSICSEIERMQEHCNEPLCSDIVSQAADRSAVHALCKGLVSRKTAMSEVLLDIAWLLKEPLLDKNEVLPSSMHIRRLNCLLKYLLQKESVSILGKVLDHIDIIAKGKDLNIHAIETFDTDMRLFFNYVNTAREFLHQKLQINGKSVLDSRKLTNRETHGQGDPTGDKLCAMPCINENVETRKNNGNQKILNTASQEGEADVPLITNQFVQRADCYPLLEYNWQQESWVHRFSSRITTTRLAIFIMVSVVMCCAFCVTLIHPHKAGEIMITLRRCLFGVFSQ